MAVASDDLQSSSENKSKYRLTIDGGHTIILSYYMEGVTLARSYNLNGITAIKRHSMLKISQ